MHRVAPVLFLWHGAGTGNCLAVVRVPTYPQLFRASQTATPDMLKRYALLRKKREHVPFERVLRVISAYIAESGET